MLRFKMLCIAFMLSIAAVAIPTPQAASATTLTPAVHQARTCTFGSSYCDDVSYGEYVGYREDTLTGAGYLAYACKDFVSVYGGVWRVYTSVWRSKTVPYDTITTGDPDVPPGSYNQVSTQNWTSNFTQLSYNVSIWQSTTPELGITEKDNYVGSGYMSLTSMATSPRAAGSFEGINGNFPMVQYLPQCGFVDAP